jgi:lipopolysaccharide/colanic/teichoic acid biosynthesis glycosyltransferase
MKMPQLTDRALDEATATVSAEHEGPMARLGQPVGWSGSHEEAETLPSGSLGAGPARINGESKKVNGNLFGDVLLDNSVVEDELDGYRRALPLKWLVDRIAAFVLLAPALPLMLLIALVIRLENTGPVLFSQTRLGWRGSRFQALKFRTMYVDAERRLANILETDQDARAEYETFRKLRDDPRLTRVGRFLRRYSLDELPQLINVLRGEMSVVGPRPYMPRELPAMGSATTIILSGMPGLTGLWQVSGRNSLSFEQRLSLDMQYVRRYSVVLDASILLRTLNVVWTGEGAF